MAFQMVDGQKRLACRGTQRLGGHQTDHHSADQPGARGRGNTVHRRQADPRLGQGLADQAVKRRDMGAGGDLRDHAAKGTMVVELGQDDIGQNAAVVGDNGGGGFVAAGLDSQNQGHDFQPHAQGAKWARA